MAYVAVGPSGRNNQPRTQKLLRPREAIASAADRPLLLKRSRPHTVLWLPRRGVVGSTKEVLL
ncbi:hypothetical protein BN13_400015 [Nostocoides jenkinsii Ben 74]|uniref:Uncharacterized protein n=1 Tax=Nostocoides jenkinsii Ben 74 TaxID=1193518 RepID=A0A077MCU6_9MICO|nr:hypothetical protein BN13_1890006 [Tetrasphaera jenkinsii Ben 74]CCI53525.1 hypothetical protein BN13_400015 [Tetrasphaera jenkinsii Ben 74]